MNHEERSRDWCFAIENYCPADEELCQSMAADTMYSVVATRVRADGTPMLQGYVYFKSQKTEERMSKYLPRAAFVRRTTVANTTLEASLQCKEDATTIAETGTLPKLGRKSSGHADDSGEQTAEEGGTVQPPGRFQCSHCLGHFKTRAGLWKHKKICNASPEELAITPSAVVTAGATPPTVATDRDLVMMLIRESSDLKNLMIEQQSKMMEQQQNLVLEIVRSNNGVLTTSTNANALTAFSNNATAVAIANAAANNPNSAVADHQSAVVAAPHQTNTLNNLTNNTQNNHTNNSHNSVSNQNSHNKTFNLNFFLNETCKNAMNMSEFVESINLELADLMRVGEMGYVDGISDIILKNLRALEITERPIHCTDKKRETFYVKDDNQWQKETPENQKIKHAINRVANKNYRLLDEYKRSHPDCHRSHSIFCDQYNKIIVEATGGNLDIPHEEKARKIIHKISKEVGIREPDNSLSC